MRIGLAMEASYQIKCNNVRPDSNASGKLTISRYFSLLIPFNYAKYIFASTVPGASQSLLWK
jgi:hypothetical protein